MAKIAISLPDPTLRAIEKARKKTGESRSHFLRRAAEAYMRREQEKEWDRQYVEGYRRMPETEEDTLSSDEWKALLAAENPWEGDLPSSLQAAASAER
jgi:metal-responsive CopG/Arc/MetJ family transcriptional regulator